MLTQKLLFDTKNDLIRPALVSSLIERASDVCVLLVEDEPLIREIMSEALKDAGYEVIEAESGDMAVEMMRGPLRRVRILVTDFHMPGKTDGSEVAARMRAFIPSIPVVIASGRPDIFQNQWQQDFGYKFLKKPFLPSHLLTVVASLVGQPADPPSRDRPDQAA